MAPDDADQLRLISGVVPPPQEVLGALRVNEEGGWILTVTLSGALVPPGPVQVKVKVELVIILPVVSVSEGVLEPDHPPDAVQEVASVEVQDRVTGLL